MATYQAPLNDMQFALSELVDLPSLLAMQPDGELSADLVDSVLQEAARFASGVIAPTDRAGHEHGSTWSDGEVRTAPGFKEAYRRFVEAGWHALPCRPEHGGQGFPRAVSALVDEMWRSANLALMGCVALTRGAIEALELRASPALQDRFLPSLVKGTWTGSMNLTEPQAGSDLSAIRSRAEPHADGTYRVFGQKIFISWGQHDLTDNIVHLVLARTPDAPPGIRGISMFLVPKVLPGVDGGQGVRNDVHCASIERKVGQHGSPTTMLVYGEDGVPGYEGRGAVGYLVGELHRGIETMFIMMNEARFAVGLEGLAVSERAYQEALAYAQERVQGTEVGGAAGERVAIVRHPDVRRMLLRMRSATEGMRALAVVIGEAMDIARMASEPDRRDEARAFVELMTPVFKGWNTEIAQELTSHGVQIHGGMGFMDECAASQFWRDARIQPIYEGTTAIQANDLVGRKLARDDSAARRFVARMQATATELAQHSELASIGRAVRDGAARCEECVRFVVAHYGSSPKDVLAVATSILDVFGIAAVGWQLGRSALAAQRRLATGGSDADFLRAKVATARFFAEQWMPRAEGSVAVVRNGGSTVTGAQAERLFEPLAGGGA